MKKLIHEILFRSNIFQKVLFQYRLTDCFTSSSSHNIKLQRSMLSKAITFIKKTNDHSSERYGLKTLKCLKQPKEFVPFKNNLIDMLKVTKFNVVKNQFRTKLKNNLKKVHPSKKH